MLTIRRRQLSAAITAAILAGTSPVVMGQNIDLAQLGTTHPGIRIGGDVMQDYSGTTVSGAGDVNGDGFADVLVGAPGNDAASPEAGAAYIVFGGRTADLDVANISTAGILISGNAGSDMTGTSISGAGDVNGDGIGDYVVGISNASVSGADPYTFSTSQGGRTYVVFGSTTVTNLDLSVGVGSRGFEIEGADGGDLSGARVSGAGDVNGDGRDDLLIAAPGQGEFNDGELYVVFGKADNGPLDLTDFDVTGNGFRLAGTMDANAIAQSSGVGDFNGDGLDDILVRTAGSTTRAAVIFGKTSTTAVSLFSFDGTQGMAITGANLNVAFLSGAGDVNGDGLNDIIVGRPNAVGQNFNSGVSTVVFGRPSSATVDLDTLGAADGFEVLGANSYDYSGDTVAGAGDINGDGFADVLVGIPRPYTSYGGAAFVIFGKNNGNAVNLSPTLPGAVGYRIDREVSGDRLGSSLSSAGDFNADGLSDILLGARLANGLGGEVDAGRSYVIFSDDASLPVAVTYRSTAPSGDPGAVGVGTIGNGSNELSPDSRFFINFGSGNGPGPSGSSMQTVTLNRDASTIDLGGSRVAADVFWQLDTDRLSGWTGTIGLRYTDAEVAGLAESELVIYTASAVAGPWTPLTTIAEPTRNKVIADITAGGFFAIGTAPEIDLVRGASIADGGSDTLGNRTIGTVNLTYTVDNLGGVPLNVSSPTAGSFTNVSGFSVTTPPATSVPANSSTSFGISFNVDINGPFSFNLNLGNSDDDENPYNITVSGNGVGGTPEISLQPTGAGNIPDGGNDPLGDVIIGRVDLSYTINNTGTANLSVTSPSASNLVNASAFEVLSPPTTPVVPGGSTTVDIRFVVDDFGPFSLDLNLLNNDSNENPYNFTISGTGSDTQVFPDDGSITMGDQFGSAVAGAGNLFAVGIPGGEGDPGKVIVYLLEGTTLSIDQVIPVPAGYDAANFGASLAMEGNRLLIGAPGDAVAAARKRGAKGIAQLLQAALYAREGDNWVLKQPLSSGGSSSDGFGASVAMDGDTLVIGAPGDTEMGAGAGAAYVLTPDGNNFMQNKLTPGPGQAGFGMSVAASGGKVGVGAPNSQVGNLLSGSVSMFQMIGNNVDALGSFNGSSSGNGDGFGTAISMDAGGLIVGSPGQGGQGAAYLFQFNGAGYSQSGQVTPGNQPGANFGTAVGLANGQIAVGAPGMGNGAVMTYDFSLQLQQTLQALAGQAGFGQSLNLGSGGLVIGAPSSGGAMGEAVLMRDPGLIFAGNFEQK